MAKKILPILLGAMVAVGLAASAQAGSIKIKVRCNTSVDWVLIGTVEFPSFAFAELGDCPAGGSFEGEHDLQADTEEVLLFAESEFGGECWIDQGNQFDQQYNAKGKCVEGDEKIKLKFKTLD